MAARHTTFTLTFRPTAEQEAMLSRHCGAARFAYNCGLRMVKDGLSAKQAGTVAEGDKVPWTGFDLINAFNRWKHTEAAGVAEGKPGLPWQGEVCAQVFEESLVDLGRALDSFAKSKRGERRGRPVRFPVFKKKGRCRDSFRMRNKPSRTKHPIRLGDDGPRSLTLPKLGCLKVVQCTRRIRRMQSKGRCLIRFATVFASRGKWHVRLNCEASARIAPEAPTVTEPVGIDRGLCSFAVVASASGQHQQTLCSPRPLARSLRRLRRLSRCHSHKKDGSRNRHKSTISLGKLHGRIRDVRHDFLHRVSTDLVKTHDHLVLEDLNTSGLMKNRSLARHIADSGWAIFAKNVTYKATWWGRTVTCADRFYPSSKRCSACGHVAASLPLSLRQHICEHCGVRQDRDLNAARNLAQWPMIVAGKHPETQNARGGRSAGTVDSARSCETAPCEAGRGSPQRPRRAVLTEIVNTL